MMCYKEMTFCTFESCCFFGDCRKSATVDVWANAEKLSQTVEIFVDMPGCYIKNNSE